MKKSQEIYVTSAIVLSLLGLTKSVKSCSEQKDNSEGMFLPIELSECERYIKKR